MKQLICDPDMGWKYGFPKPIPHNYLEDYEDLESWLVANGYPQEQVDYWKATRFKGVPCRFWEKELGETES